jgi:phosphatidate phosphatase APP1
MREGDERSFTGRVQLIGETGLSVISDIDDTIKISEVNNPVALVENTFAREFRPIPGMADRYRKWSQDGAVFHYVSASPWQLYAPLEAFLADHHFPPGSFHLKEFRWKDSRFVNLFTPSDEIMLVGDSGERDAELYADLARNHKQVTRILIRDPKDDADADRYRKAFDGLPRERWTVFRDPARIAE